MTLNSFKFKRMTELSLNLFLPSNIKAALVFLCLIAMAAFAQAPPEPVAAATTAASAPTYTDLYDFNQGPNDPNFTVIAQGRDGNIYSTTPQTWSNGQGDVFKITPTGTLTVLHQFHGTDGAKPIGGLTLATDGKFYGTTTGGGTYGHGTIFSITAEGTLTTLYSFTGGADGSVPLAAPIEGLDGNFYGTAQGTPGALGNANVYGVAYKITPAGVFTTLHTFAGTDGANPVAPLMEATDGNFYGTASGRYGCCATIFRISASGKFEVLFNSDATSYAPLIQGSDGSLYGNSGGAGTVFKITLGGTFTVLHTFTGGSDGTNAVGGMVQATDGNFYGTNNLGGAEGWGVLYRVSSTGAFTVLHDFSWDVGASPQTTHLQHTNGVLYGETAVGGRYTNGTFYSFDVGLGPFVSFLPAAGGVATTIEILGQGFTGTTDVSFNGTHATFEVSSDTYLTATVPAGATTGSITVTGPGGTLTSNKIFRVASGIGGPEPAVRLSDSNWQFAAHPPGVVSGLGRIFVTNVGKSSLEISGAQIIGGFDSFAVTNNCPATLGINHTCNLDFTFKPTRTGKITASAQLQDNAPNSPQTILLQGVGIGPALQLLNTAWGFSPHPVGQTSGPGTVFVTNVGPALLHFSSISIGGPDAADFSIVSKSCGSTLEAYKTCSVTFQFTPTAAGTRTAVLNFADDAIPAQQSMTLSGTGTTP